MQSVLETGTRLYSLFGHLPAQVLLPETIAEAQECVRAMPGQAMVPWGGGMRQTLGYAPERYDCALSTLRLNSVTEYHPADLTITVQAGMTLADVQAVLAEHHQWLPLEVAVPERQTVGGIIATRADSLLRLSRGSIRDLLLGVTVINSRGEWIKGGGRVVKNVAGYDLPKLYCGALGTLGLIAEATFKIASLSESSATVVLPLPADHNSEDVLDHVMASELHPSFLFLLNPSAALDIVGPDASEAQYLVLGLDGASETIQWQLETLGASAISEEESAGVRSRLRDYALAEAPMTASFHILSSQIGAFARMVEWTARRAGFAARVWADAAVGILGAHFMPMTEASDWHVFYHDLKDKADRVGGSFMIERMPDALRTADVPVWSPLLPDFKLMARLKESLDPLRMWNPGRFVGQI